MLCHDDCLDHLHPLWDMLLPSRQTVDNEAITNMHKHNLARSPTEVSSIVRKSIVSTAREYAKRSSYYPGDLGLPEYLLTVRIYDSLWKNLNTQQSAESHDGKMSVTLEEQSKYVKAGSLKKGPTAKVVSGTKRHDLCIWLDEDPMFIVEVKRFTNRYQIFDKDIKRLESVVKGSNAPNYSILAFFGSWLYGSETIAKHFRSIEDRFPDHTVCMQKFGFQGIPDYNLSGTIVVAK